MHLLPQGLELKNSYCDLTPGSAKVILLIENTTRKNITIPAKAIVCQLNLANKIPKLLLPTSNPEEELTEDDIEFDNFSQSQADLDLGLTFQKVRAHQILVQDLGEDHKHDKIEPQDDLTDLKFVPKFTPKKDNEQGNIIESEDCKAVRTIGSNRSR